MNLEKIYKNLPSKRQVEAIRKREFAEKCANFYKDSNPVPLSNNPCYTPTKNMYIDSEYKKAVEEKAKCLAPSFNKGPYQPQTNTDFSESNGK